MEEITNKTVMVNFMWPAKQSDNRAMASARKQLAKMAQNPSQPL